MNILKYKYKAHKLVNTLFYVAVFVIGFILGFGTNKIDFNKLVSQVLMIDNVSATTIHTYNGIVVDEDFIYEKFIERSNHINNVSPDFDISIYPYIMCNLNTKGTLLTCIAIKEDKLIPENITFYYYVSNNYFSPKNLVNDNGINENPDVVGFQYNLSKQQFSSIYSPTLMGGGLSYFYTNFDISNTSTTPGETAMSSSYFKNVLDFSLYDSIYEYNGIVIDEAYIYERFMENNNNSDTTDFDILTFPYIYCTIYDVSTADSTDPRLFCNAVKEELLNPEYLLFYTHPGYSNFYAGTLSSVSIRDNGTVENPNIVGFQYRIVSETFTSKYPASVMYTNNAYFYTNFDKSNVGYGSHALLPDSRFHNVLDFSRFDKLQFNENLFKDNPDFKEVCVPNNKKFGIISNEYNIDENITDETLNNRYYIDRDYIWFPNGVKGLSTFFYHNKSENNVKVIDKDDASYSMYGYWYWLNSKEEINKYFGELPTSAMLIEAGYTDKYKYYNYTMHPFLIRYIGYEDDYMFNVFWFKELGVNHIDSDIVDYPEDYCFYIKNKYDVVLLNSNEWGDLYTDITILGDKDITISTSQNESDVNNVGIFSVVNNFIYQIKGTIIFINTNIHNLFLAMPLIVRMFILSVLTVFIIKFIIDMIVR